MTIAYNVNDKSTQGKNRQQQIQCQIIPLWLDTRAPQHYAKQQRSDKLLIIAYIAVHTKGKRGMRERKRASGFFLADSKQSNAALKQSSHPTKKLHTISAFIKKSPLQRSRRIVTQQSCVLTSLYNLLNIFVQGSHCKHLMHCSKRRKTKVLEQYTV